MSKGSLLVKKASSSRYFAAPKKFVRTINDQLRQVLSKLPSHVSHRKTIHDSRTTKKELDGLKNALNGYGNSEIVPNDSLVVEVFDQRKVDNNILKRDEIRRPPGTRGGSGLKRDHIGIKHGNLEEPRSDINSKSSVEQSLTEVIVDDSEGEHGIEQDILSDNDSTQTKVGVPKTKIPALLKLRDFNEHDLKSLEKLVKGDETDSELNDKHYENENINRKQNFQKKGFENKNNNKNDTDYHMNTKEMHYLDTIAKNHGITDENKLAINNETTNDDKKNDSLETIVSVNNKNNNNGKNSSNNNNDNNNVNNNNKNSKNGDNLNASTNKRLSPGKDIQELMTGLGSLRSQGREVSDEQLTKLQETVQKFLNLKTVTSVKEKEREGKGKVM